MSQPFGVYSASDYFSYTQDVVGACQAGSAQGAMSEASAEESNGCIADLGSGGAFEDGGTGLTNSMPGKTQFYTMPESATSQSPASPLPTAPPQTTAPVALPHTATPPIALPSPPTPTPQDDAASEVPAFDNSAGSVAPENSLPPLNQSTNLSPGGEFGAGSESSGDLSHSNQYILPSPQVSPVPLIVMTAFRSDARPTIEIPEAKRLVDISEFLPNHHQRQTAAFSHGNVVKSTHNAEANTNRSLNTRWHYERPVESVRPFVPGHATISNVPQSKPRVAGLNVLMPAQVPVLMRTLVETPLQSVTQNVNSEVISETTAAPKGDESKSTESVKAEITKAPEKQLGRRTNTLLGVMIASVVGMPHALGKRLLRQRNRETRFGSFDQFS